MDDTTRSEDRTHTSSDTVDDGGPSKASSTVNSKDAGKHTGPPGSGPRDEAAIDAGMERLDQAGGGH